MSPLWFAAPTIGGLLLAFSFLVFMMFKHGIEERDVPTMIISSICTIIMVGVWVLGVSLIYSAAVWKG
ncbi:MAG: hypothetical protein WC554_08440 [Clostridia bacterium]